MINPKITIIAIILILTSLVIGLIFAIAMTKVNGDIEDIQNPCIFDLFAYNVGNLEFIDKRCSAIGDASSQRINATIIVQNKDIGVIRSSFYPSNSNGEGHYYNKLIINNPELNSETIKNIIEGICFKYKKRLNIDKNNEMLREIVINCNIENYNTQPSGEKAIIFEGYNFSSNQDTKYIFNIDYES